MRIRETPIRSRVRSRALSKFLILSCLLFPIWASGATETIPPPTAAAPALAPAPTQPVKVRVGIYLLNIGKLDIGTGTYSLDFYLSFRCETACNPMNFEVLNGKAVLDNNDDDPKFKVFRVRADLISQFNLRLFPFDSHRLTIVFEDRVLQDHQLVYEEDLGSSGIHPSAVVVGWTLDKQWKFNIDRDAYPIYGQNFSRATVTIGAKRPKLSAFLKHITPALIIALSGFLALLMGADKATPRLTLTTSALVGSVLFHLNMTSSMPPIPYLTLADRIMLINYLGLATVLIVNVKIMALSEKGLTDIMTHPLGRRRNWFLGGFVLIHILHALSLNY